MLVFTEHWTEKLVLQTNHCLTCLNELMRPSLLNWIVFEVPVVIFHHLSQMTSNHLDQADLTYW